MLVLSEFGLKIKNIKAGTLFGYNLGVRDRYDYTEAMLNNSLFLDFMLKHGLDSYKGESTRDIICIDFDFGSRSYEEELAHITDMIDKSPDNSEKMRQIRDKVIENKDKYIKLTKEQIRDKYYNEGVSVTYTGRRPEDTVVINYKMLFRTSAKAKIGQCMFINEKLYEVAYNWLTMGIGKKMDRENAKIVEMSAYAPLTTSTIVGRYVMPLKNILFLDDKDSFFRTVVKRVYAEEYGVTKRGKVVNTGKRCVVGDVEMDVKNTLWDGMGLIEASTFPDWASGMMLLRNHFFKMCGFRTNMQQFFKDYCLQNDIDYESFEVVDMFGIKRKIKDIRVITTNNAIKWLKFTNLMGKNKKEAYNYWKKVLEADGNVFGIVKTDHPSKFGDVQQMSYQMINTLPCSRADIFNLASNSMAYVEKLKADDDFFEEYLRKNANDINHFEMMADLYAHNHDFANSQWFRNEKKKIIHGYVNRLRKGKITVDGDNLTLCGNPYALLLYAVGDNWENDPCFTAESDAIQCYTTRYDDLEYICAIRSPHNSPNNMAYLHNVKSDEMKKYFPFSKNIIAVNCIGTDIQSRLNGADFDSDFIFTTTHPVMVNGARMCYSNYPTIVNDLKESGITYENTLQAYSDMDNKFAKCKLGIGWSSNLAQLAMCYYWTEPSKELYDNFVILSVIAQVIIDGCKREYEVDGMDEIKRIRKLKCMNRYELVESDEGKTKKQMKDFPKFMKYTKEVKLTKNGKERNYSDVKREKNSISNRIDMSIECPMNYLQDCLNTIPIHRKKNSVVPTSEFFIKYAGDANRRQMKKVKELIKDYDDFVYQKRADYIGNKEEITNKFKELIDSIAKIKIKNDVTINRLLEIAMGVETLYKPSEPDEITKNCTQIMNCLYRVNKDKFLKNFKKQ